VLRKSKGKEIADLYDFLVIGGASDAKSLRALAGKELRRAEQFAADAENRSDLERQLQELKDQLGLKAGEPNA